MPIPGTDVTDNLLTLIHVEVESQDSAAVLPPRMFDYYVALRRKHALPLLPIALFLKVGLDGIGWARYEERFWDDRILQFDFPYVGLPALSAEKYLHLDNPLGVALSALMKSPPGRKIQLATEAWGRLVQAPESEYRRFLLCECVDAYAPQGEQERSLLQKELLTTTDPGVRAMTMTMFEKLRLEGRQAGILEGQREALLVLIESRLGSPTSQVRERVERASASELQLWLRKVGTANSLEELGL